MITDQADRLRRWVKRKELGLDLDLASFVEDKISSQKRMIVFLGSDEEAAANSNLLANIAVSCAKKGKRCIILDAYPGKVDASIPLGIHMRHSSEEALLLSEKKKDLIHVGSAGVKFVKVGNLLSNLEDLDFKAKKNFFNHWLAFEEEADIVFLNEDSPKFALAVNEVIMVTSASGKMLTKSYEMVKQLVHNTKGPSLGLVVNMCLSEKEALAAAHRFIATVRKFLDVEMKNIGLVHLVPEVVRALKARNPFVLKYPYCQATQNVNGIADSICAAAKSGGVLC